LVDKLAKAAAALGRAPFALRRLLTDASQAVEHSAALLGLTTYAANSYKTTEWRADGSAHTLTRRDAQPPAYLARGRGARPKATGPRATTTPTQPQTQPDAACDADAAEKARLEDLHQARLDHHKRARARAREATASLADAQDARALASWQRDQAAAPQRTRPADQPTAAERLEALRRRVAAKAIA